MSETPSPSLLHVSFAGESYAFLSDAFKRAGLHVTDMSENGIYAKDMPFTESFDYIVINTLSFTNENKTNVIISLGEKLIEYAKGHNAKVLFLLPVESLLSKSIRDLSVTSAILLVSQNAQYVDESVFAHEIERNLFSLRAYGKEEEIRGIQIKSQIPARNASSIADAGGPMTNDQWEQEKKANAKTQMLNEGRGQDTEDVDEMGEVEKRRILNQVQDDVSKVTFSRLKEKIKITLPKRKKKEVKGKRRGSKKRVLAFGVVGLIVVALAPYILAFSALLIAASGSSSDSTKKITAASESLGYFYAQEGGVLTFYNDALTVSRIAKGLVKSREGQKIVTDTRVALIKNITSGKQYDVDGMSKSLVFSFEDIYSSLGFSLSELESITWTKPFVYRFISQKEIESERKNILAYKQIAKDLPVLLGAGKAKTYAFVLQNDKILRPTGGRIEEVALVTLLDGTIEEIETFEVGEDDTKLGGTITAPAPIAKYLKKENWSLKDANWDFAFPQSAERIAWFIDKEFDQKVDGVIGIEEEMMNGIEGLETGEGLEKKIRAFFEILGNKKSEGFTNLAKVLSEKKILFSVAEVTDVLGELEWNGDVREATCEGNCITDTIGVVESNFGEEAGDLKREAEVKTSLEEGVVKHKLTYYVKNMTDRVYKMYVRVFTSGDAGFSPVTVLKVDGNTSIEPEVYGIRGMKEAGVYVEIPAGKTYGLEYNWESASTGTFNENGSYVFSFFKQPGVASFPISLAGTIPLSGGFSLESNGFLTKGDSFAYNSVLTEDLKIEIKWKK